MDRYQKSLDYLARALKVTPGGAQTMSKRANRFTEGAYPVALTYGHGPYVWDLDGYKYLDMICGLACMTLGYDAYSQIQDAVERQLRRGVSFSLAHPLEADVAEKLCAMIPCAEQVRFVKTGSEANEAAIRVARKATGRDLILTVGDGYSSWHSWFQILKPMHPGIPYPYSQMVHSFNYNDLVGLGDSLQACAVDGYKVAAVILEPCHYDQPNEGFLEGVRSLCTEYGTVLIFDEMVTGFRWANGGAQAYYGVTPDLATFGKACANGFPLSFVCGKAELMQHADVVSGTFGGETLSLAACNAVLDIYKSEPIIEMLWMRGKQFQDGFNDMAHVLDVQAICDGFAVKPRIKFVPDSNTLNSMRQRFTEVILKSGDISYGNLCMSLFLQEIALRGILWHPAGGNVSVAMTEQDIEFALTGMGEALTIVKRTLDFCDWSGLQGKPIQATPFVRKA
jgi:glutamate-1-semialdehyde aminotransferase